MADFDQAAYVWIPAANQVAYNYPGSNPEDWFNAIAYIPNIPLTLASWPGAGGGPGAPAGPRGYPIGR